MDPKSNSETSDKLFRPITMRETKDQVSFVSISLVIIEINNI